MKLPKGIKKMRAAASEDALEEAMGLVSAKEFNGYVRVTAPKGIKEAGIVLYLMGDARIAVFQSPGRSLYGQEAIGEFKRIATTDGATLRIEEFYTHTIGEVQTIVKKMRKASIGRDDLEAELRGAPPEAKAKEEVPEPEGQPEVEPEEEVSPEEPGEEVPKEAAEETEAPKEEAVEGPEEEPTPPEEEPRGKEDAKVSAPPPVVPMVPKVPKVRAKVADRIVKSQSVTAPKRDDDDILRVLKEVGMSPPVGEEEEVDDEVKQYIAAFEDFLTKKDEGATPVPGSPPSAALIAVEEIIDDMMNAAGDNIEMMEFIEGQRERILHRISTADDLERRADKVDTLTEQQNALEHISSTFSEVLKASQKEAERRKERIALLKGEGDTDLLDEETRLLSDEEGRVSELEGILGRVVETHRARLEEAEGELEEAEVEKKAEAEVPGPTVDLDAAKADFLDEMRTRIQSVADVNGSAPKPGKVAEAVHDVSAGIHDQVEELEQEHEILTRERRRLEEKTEDLEHRKETLEVDQEIEVQARLKELEEREAQVHQLEEELQARRSRLEGEHDTIERDLDKARADVEKVSKLEAELREREDMLKTRESELEVKHKEADGLKDHLEQDIAKRLAELESLEDKLKAREMELVARETEVERSLELTDKEQMEKAEDLKRMETIEGELKQREEEYSETIESMEKVIEALREELKENIEKVEELEERLSTLHGAEGKIKELEEKLAESPGEGEGMSEEEKEDLRKLLAYLDDLLSKLPDKEIKRFSDSDYFELYGRVLDRLGI